MRGLNFVIIWLCSFTTMSQNFKWLNTYGTGKGRERIHKILADEYGGCSFIASSAVSALDTLVFGSYKYELRKSSSANFLVKLDSNGKVTNVRILKTDIDITMGMCGDGKGNIYLCSWMSQSSKEFFDGDTLYASNGQLVFAKYDQNLQRIWLKQTGVNLFYPKLNYTDGHILFIAQAGDSSKISG